MELKTPVYPLYSADVENIWFPETISAINAENHEKRWWSVSTYHYHRKADDNSSITAAHTSPIYGDVSQEAETDYCKGKPELSLKTDGEKYQAIKLWENRIELRFQAKVYNIEALIFRLDFCRLMLKAGV